MQTIEKPLTEQTPVEIDGQLHALYIQRLTLDHLIGNEGRRIEIVEDSIAADEAAGHTELIAAKQDRITAFRHTLADLELQRAALRIDEEPLEAEFARRGGWTRAFIVTGGHVHTSRSCSSCRPTTRFTWLTAYSGRTEGHIVQDSGERACTICFPSAPVDVLRQASVVFSDEERAEHEARGRRNAAAARQDGPRSKKLVHPRGEVLRDFFRRPCTTESAAIIGAACAIRNSLRPDPGYTGSAYEAEDVEIIRIAVEALAHKHGTDEKLQLDILTAKAITKFIQRYRNSLDAQLLALDLRVLKARIKLARG